MANCPVKTNQIKVFSPMLTICHIGRKKDGKLPKIYYFYYAQYQILHRHTKFSRTEVGLLTLDL